MPYHLATPAGDFYFIAFSVLVKYNLLMQSNKSSKNTLIFLKTRGLSFKAAFQGLGYALKTQKNMWIHAFMTVLVVIVGFFLKISLLEWIPIVIVTGLVWMAELINTAIEAIVDLISPEIHPIAKIAKDVSAGFVVIAAIVALIVGCLIFIPRLLEIII